MQEDSQNTKNAEEIDLIEVFKKIWAERKFILKAVAIFFVLGLIIAIGTPKEYKAETTLLVETSGGSSINGLLQQFGGLAGLSLGNQQEGENLSPDIYPQIIQSTPFLIEIMADTIHSSKAKAMNVYEYLSTQVKPSIMDIVLNYTIGLPGKVIGFFSKKDAPNYVLPLLNTASPIKLTKPQESKMKSLKGRIKLQSDETTGTIVISAEMPDPIAAAELTNLAFKYLSKYLVDYKVQKVKTDLTFIEKQYQGAKQRYVEAQQRLAYYRDANRNVTLASYKTEEDRLISEYTLAFNVFNGLAQQLEQAKLKVQEKTPVLKVIDPVKVPLNKSKPRNVLILFSMMFLGGFISIGIILFKNLFK